jgi:signal transduction histidine kinase/ligand-binding sensor domain-containing protein
MFLSARQKKRRLIISRLFVFLSAVGLFFSLSIMAEAELLPVKTYTVADGLLVDDAVKIKQDSRGFMWFCTWEGISRFDGAQVTNFTKEDGLPGHYVEDFLETSRGTIYLATIKGLARLNPHGLRGSKENPLFTTFVPENPKAHEIHTLYEDRQGQIWVGTSDGLYKLSETDGQVTFENVPLGKSLPGAADAIAAPAEDTLFIDTILEDRKGLLWIATNGSGLFRLSPDGGVRRFRAAEDGFGDNRILDLLEDHNGNLWMSLRNDDEGGVCLLNPETDVSLVKKCYLTKDGLPSNHVRDLFETRDGQMWLATNKGLCQWQGDNGSRVCKTYSVQNDLCEEMMALAEDRDGNLWTSSTCGAKKIVRYGFTTYKETDGLGDDFVVSIFENSAGELFAINYPNKNGRFISRFEGDKFSLVRPALPAYVNYHGWGVIQTVRQDSKGVWWIPSGFGLFRTTAKTNFNDLATAPLERVETGATWFPPEEEDKPELIEKYGEQAVKEIKYYEVFRLFEDSRGDIWILTTTTANEIFRWERAKNIWHNYTVQTGLSDSRVGMSLAEDGFGNIWIGASSDHNQSALIRFRDGEFRILSEAEGGPSGWLRDLFFDSRGRLWITSDSDGLWRLDEPNSDRWEFVKYTSADGLTSFATACVTEDEYGRIYIGTRRGIDRLNPDTGQIENFTTSDGLPASAIDVAYRDRKNNLWFGTEQGLTRFVPEPPRTRLPPTTLITGLRVNGESQSVSSIGETALPMLDLSSDQRQITIDFIGLGATLGEKLKYEYRFGGADWTQTTERTVNFANLASGEYRFELRAVSADRIVSAPAFADFRIAAPIWQRWWFIGLVTALVTFVIYLIYRNRLARLIELERTRTRIATDLHDDIGTNLSKISLLSGIVSLQLQSENAQHRQMLNSIAEISRESVTSMSDIVWAINPQRDSVLEMARRMREFAEEIFIEKEVRVKFRAPDEQNQIKLAMDTRRELYLIFKEAVTNAAKYSGCTALEIDFQVDGATIFLEIKDDGGGFDATRKTDGNGLENIRNRARKLGGTIEISSNIGQGTKISIHAPCENTQVKTDGKKIKVTK